jgi:hypothetical protein
MFEGRRFDQSIIILRVRWVRDRVPGSPEPSNGRGNAGCSRDSGRLSRRATATSGRELVGQIQRRLPAPSNRCTCSRLRSALRDESIGSCQRDRNLSCGRPSGPAVKGPTIRPQPTASHSWPTNLLPAGSVHAGQCLRGNGVLDNRSPDHAFVTMLATLLRHGRE